ncbi:hypothetical protein A6302_00457 [Methylobrevis pamukkalensis]|uniref:Uncharacterized protein n=1 Tax=Methylobrevis pamukkalensis TaxID=1439726 RepID=A0A1E3H743_9HYPH|nr:hypothetical protein A6302_00457 [Methylobrevis pamukkalensis]
MAAELVRGRPSSVPADQRRIWSSAPWSKISTEVVSAVRKAPSTAPASASFSGVAPPGPIEAAA